MEDKYNLDRLRGLFEGGSFPNAQINVLTGDGVQISYESPKKKAQEERYEGVKQSVMDYVGRLMPVVEADYREQYEIIWKEILEQDAVSQVVYDRGRQQGTLFNRKLVAQVSHMMVGGVIIKNTTDVKMAELLEPEKGKDHSVRGALGVSPEDKQVKKAVKEVLEKHGVKVS